MQHHTTTFSKGSTPGRGRISGSVRSLLLSLAVLTAIAVAAPATALAAPSAMTNPASNVHHTSAVLSGHLDPGGDPGITECKFEWGTTVAYGNTVPCNEGNAFGSPADVSANLNNLTPGSTYHFRLSVETTSSGPLSGADQSFRPDTFLITRGEIGSFGPDGTSASSFLALRGVVFYQTARDLFALDRNAEGIYGYDASNPPAYSPLAAFDPLVAVPPPGERASIAVDNTALASSGNVYYASYSGSSGYGIYGFSPSGTPLPGFPVFTSTGDGCGVAVDSAGHLWVANHHQTIEEFSSSGAKISSVGVPSQSAVCALAFDSNDDMYVAAENTAAWKYTAVSGYASGVKFADGPNNNIAVDPSTHKVYFGRYAEPSSGRFPYGPRVDEYDSAGHFLGEFGVGIEGNSVAVDAITHNVFVTGSDGKIHVFGGAETVVKLPTPTTGEASAITGATATLTGAVDPEGMPVTECHIAWGTSASYGNEAPCSPSPGSGSGDVAVSADINGLTSGTEYHFRVFASSADGTTAGRDVSFTTNFPPSASRSPISNLTNGSADLNGQVNPKGFPTAYRFEWGSTAAYGNSAPVPDGSAGSGNSNVAVSGHIGGLAPNTRYFWRLVAENINGSVKAESDSFITLGAPIAETTGAPMRTITSAQLGGRVAPRGFATNYFFEYGDQGPCDANPCSATSPQSAGSGEITELVSEEIEGLQPNTTYHYRVVADNGQPGSPVSGADMTITTHSSQAPLSHGHLPGPPGSDRAYEQISPPDTGGNPVNEAMGFSTDGNRALYAIAGGTPLSDTGNIYSVFFAQRRETGPHEGSWQPKSILPPRGSESGSSRWKAVGDDTLSSIIAGNSNEVNNASKIWHLNPEGPPAKLFEGTLDDYVTGVFATSDDGSRLIARLGGSQDPEHPSGGGYFDLTSGAPHLANLLPDGSVPPCGTVDRDPRGGHPLTPDGSRLFFTTRSGFSCGGASKVYVRDLGTEQTELISPPPISGEECDAVFLSSTSQSVFLWSKSRLSAEDTDPNGCADNGLDGDAYRYQLNDGTLKCLTCAVAGQDADIRVQFDNGAWRTGENIAISEDGSRVYFQSPHALAPGALAVGKDGGMGNLYRVNVNTGDLAWVGGPDLGIPVSSTPDGATALFVSRSSFLNPLNGSDNGGTAQLYRYDDRDRSLICLSCPLDGSAALSGGPGGNSISDDGKDIAFATATSLVGADQNSPDPGRDPESGLDIYEWRDGRYFLVTDGLTNTTPGTGGPSVASLSADGRDLYFIAAAQYTPDALDGYRRLYDARIGGGFESPKPPPPCPLEVCQGTPKGAPEEQAPGTGSFSGPGNAKPRQAKHAKKHKAKKRHHKQAKKHAKNRANDNRRTAR